jgi:hypothetical protein
MALDRGTQAVLTVAAFNAVAFVFIVLRCISRFWVVHQAGPEDYLIIFALACAVGVTVSIAIRKSLELPRQRCTKLTIVPEEQYGLGRHADTVSVDDIEILSKVNSPPECQRRFG